MKNKEIKQIKDKPVQELQKNLVEYRETLRKLKFDLSQGKVKNIKQIKETKKMIARILTILNQRQTTKD